MMPLQRWKRSQSVKFRGECCFGFRSSVVNEWISRGEARGKLVNQRQNLLKLLTKRFPADVPDNVVQLINEQESLDILDHWFDAAADAYTFQQFLAVLKQ